MMTGTTKTTPPAAYRATVAAAPGGKPGRSIAANMSNDTITASKARSTASDANAVENGTRSTSRESAYARAGSPARAGATLLTIIPIAVARQSGPKGRFGSTGSRIVCQRRARSGNVPGDAIAESNRSQ